MILGPLALLAALFLPPQDAGAPRGLEASPPEIQFGDAFQGEVLEQEVSITNHGSEPVPIARIVTSCGCTVPTLRGAEGEQIAVSARPDEGPIYVLEPGATISIDVEFKTAGKMGLQQQRVSVMAEGQTQPALQIPLSIRISTPIAVNPPFLNMGLIKKGAQVEQIVKLNALAIGDWSVTGFESRMEGRPLPEWLKLEMLDESGSERRLRVLVDGPDTVGTFNHQVEIGIDHERVKTLHLSVAGIVEPNVTFDTGGQGPTNAVVFDEVSPEGQATRTIRILNDDPSQPYLLEEVELIVAGRDVDAHYQTDLRVIEPGMIYEVDLTVKGSVGGGLDDGGNVKSPFFRGTLRLLADHDDLPRKLLQFHGWVKTASRG